MSKDIVFDVNVPDAILRGINTLANAAKVTLLLFFLTLAGGAASARVDSTDVPSKAHLKPHAFLVPTNVPLGGDVWKCDRDSRESGNSCVPLEIPPNGYMDVGPRQAPSPGILHDEAWWT